MGLGFARVSIFQTQGFWGIGLRVMLGLPKNSGHVHCVFALLFEA